MFRMEIGGDFHLCDTTSSKENPNNVFEYLNGFSAAYFDSGRSALRALLEKCSAQNILLPGYICESVRDCFPADCNVQYYNITDEIKINWHDLLGKCRSGIDIVYLHFFNGYIGEEYDFEALLALKKKYNFVIIEDTTHSFFSAPHTIGDYCVCSLRKWFPIADGGVLYAKGGIEVTSLSENAWASQKRTAMADKRAYLEGLTDDKQRFLNVFASTETALDKQKQICQLSEPSRRTLGQIDCNTLISRRKENFAFLQANMNCRIVAGNGRNQVPLFFTICAENRDALRRHFIQSCIYCPVHWPLYGELETIDSAVSIYNTELSIPIDQRYGQHEMAYICQKYDDFIERGEKL